jgi:hypothetical protein
MSDDDIDDSIDAIVDSFFDAREAIFEHVGYAENLRLLPIVDDRDDFWAVDDHEQEWVKFSASKEALLYWLENDDYGPHRDKLYEHQIYTQHHLSKWIYRGKELTIHRCRHPHRGNQYLQLFRNANEVRLGDAPEKVIEPPVPAPTEHPLNQAIDRLIEVDQKSHADALIAKVRSMCAAVPPADLRAAIAAHLTICQQPGCPVLAAMEAVLAGATLSPKADP